MDGFAYELKDPALISQILGEIISDLLTYKDDYVCQKREMRWEKEKRVLGHIDELQQVFHQFYDDVDDMKEKWDLDLDKYGEYIEVKKIGDRKKEALRKYYLDEIQRKRVAPDQVEFGRHIYANWDTNLQNVKIEQKYQKDYYFDPGSRWYANWDTDFKDVKIRMPPKPKVKIDERAEKQKEY